MPERLIYEQSVEGLFRWGLAGRVSNTLKGQLREAGMDLDRKLQPVYPVEVWARCVALAAQAQYPGKPEQQAYQLLGERMVGGFKETLMGRAMLGVLRLLGPRRLLARSGQFLRAGNNYVTARLTERGPTEVELWVNEVGLTRYLLQGCLVAALRLSLPSDKEPRVEELGCDAEGVTFLISW